MRKKGMRSWMVYL